MHARRFASPALLLLPLLAIACAGEPESGEDVGQTADEITVCEPATTVLGIDIAAYQHPSGASINWGSVANAGYKFAIVKATEQNDYTNSYYADDVAKARAAGIIVGSYHFLAPGSYGASGTAQANYFLSKASIKPGDLPPMLDVETSSLYGSHLPTVADITSWLDTVQAATGLKPIIYVGYYTLQSLGNPTALKGYKINIPAYGSCPQFPTGWSTADLIMHQFTSSQSVPGISGNVDANHFYGSLSQLQALAGPVDWGAKYVSQSWPLATTTLQMTVNEVIPASITLKNVGHKSWDDKTKLGTTQPRDRMSAFFGDDWLAANRPAGVPAGTTVAPNADHEFKFSFHAPSTPGTFDEFFGVLEEGVHWFSDAGQGGPPDNQIEVKIKVNEADYHAEFVSQTFPAATDAPIEMHVGETKHGTITLKNIGNQTWHMASTKLAPTPRDMSSPLHASTWLSSTRVSAPAGDVAPGDTFDFPVDLTATDVGDVTQTFGLVEEGVTWFSDAPKGGGPADDFLAVHVVVSEAMGEGGGGAGGRGQGGSTGTRGDGGSTASSHGTNSSGSGHLTSGGDGDGDGENVTADSEGGCSFGGSSNGTALSGLAIAALGIAAARRRRRAA